MKMFIIMAVAVGLLTSPPVQAQGTTYLSSLSQTSTGSNPVGNDSWLAAGFATGNNTGGYLLDSIQLGMMDASGSPNGFTAMVYTEVGVSGASPGSSLGTLNGSTEPVTAGVYTYDTVSSITLSPSAVYFIVVTSETAITAGAYQWSTSSFPPNSSGWGVLNSVLVSNNGTSGWSVTPYQGIAQFAITATAIPEPSSVVLLGLSSILLLGFGRWKAKTVG